MSLSTVVHEYTAELKGRYEGLQNVKKRVSEQANQTVFKLICLAHDYIPRSKGMLRTAEDTVLKALDDMSPVPRQTSNLLVYTQLWAAVCLVFVSVAQVLSAALLAPLVGMLFDSECSMLLTYFLLPLHYIVSVYTATIGSAPEQRSALLGLSTILGVLSGFTLSNRSLDIYGPPMFVMPAVVGLVAGLAGHVLETQRNMYLGCAVGLGLLTMLAYGFAMQCLTPSFLVWAAAASAATFVDVQFKFGAATRSSSPAAAACMTVLIQLILQTSMVYLLGSTPKALPSPAKAASRKAAKAAKEASSSFFLFF